MNYDKILLIRLGGIGDILFTLPAVYLLRDNFPQAHISFATSKEFAPIITGFPGIDQIISIDRDLYRRGNLSEIWRALTVLITKLRREKYSLVIDFQGFGETGILTFMTGANQRWGIVRKPNRRIFYNNYLTYFCNEEHAVARNLNLLLKCGLHAHLPQNQYLLPKIGLETAQSLLNDWGIFDRPFIFIQPFSNYTEKNWPLECYAELAEYWQQRNIAVVFGGGPSEQVLLEPIAQNFPIAAGKANILATAGLMQLSKIIVGGDTGMLHLAVAMGKRVVMIMNNAEYFGPYQHLDWVLSPNNNDLQEITVKTVIQAMKKAFDESQEENDGKHN